MYTVTQIGFVVVTLLCLGLILWQLRTALPRTDWTPGKQRRVWIATLAGLGTWLLVLSIVSASGFFRDFSGMPPRMGIVLVVPLLVVLLITFSPATKAVLRAVPPQNLLYLQSFRVVVELLLWLLFVQNLLPEQMTFEGRNWDILVGLTAPIVAYFGLVKRNWPRFLVLLWNVVGLLLLLNIVTIAILSMPTVFRVFMNDPANTIVAQFPFVWLPGVLVPIAYALHFFSLRQLSIMRQRVAFESV